MSEDFDPYLTWLGIPQEEQPPHYYRLLALEPFEQNNELIDYAADCAVVRLNADESNENAELRQQLVDQINQARQILLDPEKKQEYDHQLRQQLKS